ncbi:hypothetical protein BJX63DRAFT_409722 [Aspergillus granulosus]|uniref:Uncharacterized protein n=1 Tax=Aspergillus granulosus TaxID=176169 RepID=A0ABR4GYN7_9EURO
MPTFNNKSTTLKIGSASELRTEIRRLLQSRKPPQQTPDEQSQTAAVKLIDLAPHMEHDPESPPSNKDELETLQKRCRDIQTELDNYKQRVLELEELCRDMQVAYMMNSLDNSESTERMVTLCRHCDKWRKQTSGERREP